MKTAFIHNSILIVLFFALSFAHPATAKAIETGTEFSSIRINEFMAKSDTIIDWIELYNPSDYPINLAYNLRISDNPYKSGFTFQNSAVVPAKGYLVVWADDVNAAANGFQHLDFKLDADGEYLALRALDGTTIDEVYFPKQAKEITYGRANNTGEWGFMVSDTRGKANDDILLESPISDTPTLDKESGIYKEGFAVHVQAPKDTKIYYTLNGDEPDDKKEYLLVGTTIPISTSTVVRVMAEEPNKKPSKILNKTYLLDVAHDLPIIAVTMDNKDLFNEKNGLFHPVPYSDWLSFPRDDFPAFIEGFFDNKLAFSFEGETKKHGRNSSMEGEALRQISFKVTAEAGRQQSIDYKLLDEKDIQSFQGFVMHSASHGSLSYPNLKSHLNDPTMHELAKQTAADYIGLKPVVAYINAEYYGIYWIRENLHLDYFHNNFGASLAEGAGDFIIQEEGLMTSINQPSMQSYKPFLTSLEDNDLSKPDAYTNLIEPQIDVDNFIDYSAIELFSNNIDWPTNNVLYWKKNTPDGKWRWVLWDLDLAFQNFDYKKNSLERNINPGITDQGDAEVHSPWGTTMGLLLKNVEFRTKFINRYADLLNTTLSTKQTKSTVNTMAGVIAPEISGEIDKWVKPYLPEYSVYDWISQLGIIHTFLDSRPQVVRKDVENFMNKNYGEAIAGTSPVTIETNCGNTVHLNSLDIKENGWQGEYFNGVPITLTALPRDGAEEFQSWVITKGSLPPKTYTKNPLILTVDGPMTIKSNVVFSNAEAGKLKNAYPISDIGNSQYWNVKNTVKNSIFMGQRAFVIQQDSGMSQDIHLGCDAEKKSQGKLIANLKASVLYGNDKAGAIQFQFLDGDKKLIKSYLGEKPSTSNWEQITVSDTSVPIPKNAIYLRVLLENKAPSSSISIAAFKDIHVYIIDLIKEHFLSTPSSIENGKNSIQTNTEPRKNELQDRSRGTTTPRSDSPETDQDTNDRSRSERNTSRDSAPPSSRTAPESSSGSPPARSNERSVRSNPPPSQAPESSSGSPPARSNEGSVRSNPPPSRMSSRESSPTSDSPSRSSSGGSSSSRSSNTPSRSR